MALGGNAARSILNKYSLGTVGNSIAGILGGGLGGQLLGMLGIATRGGGEALDIGNIIGSVASVGVGGGTLMGIIGLVK